MYVSLAAAKRSDMYLMKDHKPGRSTAGEKEKHKKKKKVKKSKKNSVNYNHSSGSEGEGKWMH